MPWFDECKIGQGVEIRNCTKSFLQYVWTENKQYRDTLCPKNMTTA